MISTDRNPFENPPAGEQCLAGPELITPEIVATNVIQAAALLAAETVQRDGQSHLTLDFDITDPDVLLFGDEPYNSGVRFGTGGGVKAEVYAPVGREYRESYSVEQQCGEGFHQRIGDIEITERTSDGMMRVVRIERAPAQDRVSSLSDDSIIQKVVIEGRPVERSDSTVAGTVTEYEFTNGVAANNVLSIVPERIGVSEEVLKDPQKLKAARTQGLATIEFMRQAIKAAKVN